MIKILSVNKCVLKMKILFGCVNGSFVMLTYVLCFGCDVAFVFDTCK